MEKKYKTIYLPLFYKDLDNITDYIKYQLRNEIAADNFVNKLEKEINKRAFSPKYYEEYISNRKRKNKYFRLYINNYTVFYTVKNDTMGNQKNFIFKKKF